MPPIYERDAELEALATARQRALNGRGRLVVVEAPPGMGRSAVLDEAARQAERAGMAVSRARARATERAFPFGVARQLFERVITELDGVARDRAFAGAARLAEPLFGPDPPTARLDADAHFQLVHGLYWLVVNLANEQPLLLAVDDVHLADHRSASQLLYLAERLDGLRCALVVTTTTGVSADRSLSRLRAHPDARVLDLEALSVEAVTRMARELYLPDTPREVAEAVHRVSGGRPLFAHELLSALDLDDAGDNATAVERLATDAPRTVAASVARHVEDVGDDARFLVQAASVLGDDASISAVAEVANLSRPAAEHAALQLVQARVLQDADPVTFASPLVATAVGSKIAEPERRALHRRAGVALLRLGRPLTRVARHLQETSPAGEAGVVSILWSAAGHAMTAGERETAVTLLRRALAEPAPDEIRADLLIDLGTAEALVGDPAAVEHLEEAVAGHRSRDRRARALLEAGRTVHEAGRGAQAAAILARGLAQHPRDRELGVALEAAHLAATQLVSTLRGEAALPARRAFGDHGRARTIAGRSLLAHAALEHAFRLEKPNATREVLDELVARLAADHTAQEASTATAVTGALTWLGDAPAAEELAGRYLDAVRRRSELRSVTALSYRRALARWQCGDVTAVLADTELLAIDGPAAWGRYLVAGQAVRGLALIERGELPAAAALLEHPLDASSWHSSALEPMIVVARAHLSLAVGRPAEALQTFERAGELATASQLLNPVAVPWRLGTALAFAHLGERRRSRAIAESEASRAEKAGLVVARGSALHVAALATGGTRDVEVLREAVTVLEQSSGRLAHAKAVLDLGTAQLARGGSAEATDLIDTARHLADQCGALRVADRARSELERAGVRAPRRAGGNQELTPGERRVVELAVEGHTNRAIAEQLFVSVKAVEWHLRNSYSKLGVANRRELATAVTG